MSEDKLDFDWEKEQNKDYNYILLSQFISIAEEISEIISRKNEEKKDGKR